MKTKILIVASMCMATNAFAGGYRVALQGQKALGMGHTGVAMSDSSEVVFFNPSAMSFLENDYDISGGITLIDSVINIRIKQLTSQLKQITPWEPP